jgi:hypothetical protein
MPAFPTGSSSSVLLLAIAGQLGIRNRPPHGRECPSRVTSGLGIRRAEEWELGQEVVVRSEAVGADLSIGQEDPCGRWRHHR